MKTAECCRHGLITSLSNFNSIYPPCTCPFRLNQIPLATLSAVPSLGPTDLNGAVTCPSNLFSSTYITQQSLKLPLLSHVHFSTTQVVCGALPVRTFHSCHVSGLQTVFEVWVIDSAKLIDIGLTDWLCVGWPAIAFMYDEFSLVRPLASDGSDL